MALGSLHFLGGLAALGLAGGAVAVQIAPASTCSETAAYEEAKAAVREVLVAPREALFPDVSEIRVERMADCSFRVQGHVDAANMLGVTLRADYAAEILREPGGDVRLRLDGPVTRGRVGPVVLAPPATSARQENAVGPAGLEPATKAL